MLLTPNTPFSNFIKSINDSILIDCGNGIHKALLRQNVDIKKIKYVFITHLHADHVGDMPTLIWSTAKSGRRDPVEVWGPASNNEQYGTVHFTEYFE